MDSRWYRLREVVGESVILGTAIHTGNSSLFGWAYFDNSKNRLRIVAGDCVSLFGMVGSTTDIRFGR